VARKGLGRGLDALLTSDKTSSNGVTLIKLYDIEPNPGQSRKNFEPETLAELSNSIKEHGVIQPIVVRPKQNGFYEIIAGERRWRACNLLGLDEIPAIIRETDDKSSAFISLVENLQREGLNPVEEANGYRQLIKTYGLTQEEAAEKVGKSRPAVSNMLRILTLPQSALELVKDCKISFGHARALIGLFESKGEGVILELAKRIIAEELSVRETERLVKLILNPPRKNQPEKVKTSYYRGIESKISSKLARRVTIKENGGKGHISLAFSSPDDLEGLLEHICGEDIFRDN